MLKDLQQERDAQARKALQMKKKLKPVEGLADEDTREIEEANQIHLREPSKLCWIYKLLHSNMSRQVSYKH